MRCHEPQILTSILGKVPGLLDIQERAASLANLEHQVQTLLSSPLNRHCRIANYRQGILIIEVSSASWLTRFKYEQSQLLSALRQQKLPGLCSIQGKINPDIENHHVTITKPLSRQAASTMTQETAILLRTLANQAPEKLKKQLIKLANHAK